ncbi:two-component sensor histidine kinase [Janthinobacterium sp. ROICE36]|uniref:ATP-binding protein n=1 Tax=Janthinobacterium sp. ROICE36 TaxID=2048670 RepID=UPI000C7ED91E|nr:ATP-binding protein [Janthinobacterium sp. ROICE36]PLY45356.1 two-component sensor histidine kinase [Janthinobacterium sp. ROICE36]
MMPAIPGNAGAWSLRRTLLAVLLGLTFTLWGFSAAIVYLEAGRESQELFDQSLAETGHLLLSLAEHEVQEHGASTSLVMPAAQNRNHRQYLLFQVWDAQHRLMYKNAGAPDRAFAAPADVGYSWRDNDGRLWRIYTSWNHDAQLQIQVAEPASHRQEISSRFALKLLAIGLPMAALAALAIWWSINRVFRALRRCADEVAQRTPDDLANVSVTGAPMEVQPLLQAINRLFVRVRQTREQEQRFTADAAHELRTPLAAIKTNLQVLQRARSDAERSESVTGLGLSVDRATRLVGQLLTLSRLDPQSPPPELPVLDLAALLAEQLPAWMVQAQRQDLLLRADLATAPCRLQLDHVLILARNLMDNAMRYTPAGGTLALACCTGADGVLLRVSDTGPGIAEPLRERVFERFFRAAGAHQPGSGLGLSIVRRIAETHGASVQLAAGPDGTGLVVTVRFPAPTGPSIHA